MARRIRRNETLEPTHMVRGPATILTILVMESVPQTCLRWIPRVVLRFLLSKTTMSVKLMLRFWWNLKVSVFWTAVQPPRFVALRALKLCSPRVMNMILVFQRLIQLVVDHSTLEMVLHPRLLPCPDSQSEMMLLVTSGSLCICSWISRNRPMQSVCWWPLFVSSRGLFSMPLWGQHWEPSAREH